MCCCHALGTELFPDANAPLLRVRLRAPAGTRIEETERIVLRALGIIAREAGPQNVRIIERFRRPDTFQLSRGSHPSVHQRAAGSHHPGGATACRPTRRSSARTAARSAEPGVAWHASFFRSGGHRHAGDELRIAHTRRNRGARCQSAEQLRLRAEGASAVGEADIPARLTIRPGEQLPHARYQHRSRAHRPVRLDHGGRGAFCSARHIFVALHRSQLLARSEFRQCFPDSGRATAESDAEHRPGRRHTGDACGQSPAAARRRRQPQGRYHAGRDRPL